MMPTHSPIPLSSRRLTVLLAAGLAMSFAPSSAQAGGEPATGEQLYLQKCLECHGDMGRGTKDNPRILAGDKTIAQLAKIIAKTMPEDDPGTVVGDDARKVAEFMHETFYSPTAQARFAPARVDLSRLTVRQYRNAVADLIGGFRNPGKSEDQHGLRGEYFTGRGFRNGGRQIERIDPEVQFDFGETGPGPDKDKFDASQFSIRWEGSVLAPETGEYEFIVKTEHALRLFVNDTDRPLIDAWVKSGGDTEFRGAIRLLGGRAYPIRLEFSKAKQGVDDSKTNKNKPPPVKASIALEWKPPKRAAEVVPARNLSPSRLPVTYVVAAAFPPDDRSVGYERGTSVSKAWDEATTEAAIETAGYVAEHLRELSGVPPDAGDRKDRLRGFAARFAERAFRRPLTEEQKALYVDQQFAEAPDADTGLKRALLLVLKSPRFLYREVGGGKLDGHDVASRISFGLWDSLPDQDLLKAAAEGRLVTREQVAKQAERMVSDPRARSKVRDFFLQWLTVEDVPELSKDPALFPEFTPAVVSDLRTSLDLFLEEVVWGESSDFRQLYLSDELYLNGRLAKLYGADLPVDAPFRKVKLDGQQRAGLVSHPYLMARFAYTASSSPIHRGVFLLRSVLGRALRPPPAAVAPLAPDLHPNLTTRERITLQTSPQVCMSCHITINPLGFTLEHFDALGRFRDRERDKTVDSTGTYQDRSGEIVRFDGTRELAAYLASSEDVQAAFVEQVFQDLVKQPVRAFGPQKLSELREAFTRDGYRVRELLVDIIASSALTPREGTP